jgi:hypothetical protein
VTLKRRRDMASKQRSQKKLSEKQLAAIESAIKSDPNITAADAAKKARLKVSQVSCSGVWRTHLKTKKAPTAARTKKVAKKVATTSVVPATENVVTIEAIQNALADVFHLTQELEKKLKAEAASRSSAIQALLGNKS